MRNQENGKYVLAGDEMPDVVGANLLQTVEHKVVGVNEQLQEKLDTLVPDEEFVRIEVLNDAVEERLWDSLHIDQSELLAEILTVHFRLRFLPLGVSVKHGSKVLRSSPQNASVSPYVALAVEVEHHIVEAVDIHANSQILVALDLLVILFFLGRLDEVDLVGRLMLELSILLEAIGRIIILEGPLQFFQIELGLLVHGFVEHFLIFWNLVYFPAHSLVLV